MILGGLELRGSIRAPLKMRGLGFNGSFKGSFKSSCKGTFKISSKGSFKGSFTGSFGGFFRVLGLGFYSISALVFLTGAASGTRKAPLSGFHKGLQDPFRYS